MNKIVFESSELNGKLLCQVEQVEGGYIRRNILATGLTIEQDMTEDEYQTFLEQVKVWDEVKAKGKKR